MNLDDWHGYSNVVTVLLIGCFLQFFWFTIFGVKPSLWLNQSGTSDIPTIYTYLLARYPSIKLTCLFIWEINWTILFHFCAHWLWRLITRFRQVISFFNRESLFSVYVFQGDASQNRNELQQKTMFFTAPYRISFDTDHSSYIHLNRQRTS